MLTNGVATARQHAGSKSPGCMHGRGAQLCPRVLAWTTGGPFSSVDGGLRAPLPLTSRSSCCAAWPVGALQACRSGIVAPPRVVMWRMVPTPAPCLPCAVRVRVSVDNACFGACAIGAANELNSGTAARKVLSPRVPKPQLRNGLATGLLSLSICWPDAAGNLLCTNGTLHEAQMALTTEP